MNGKWGCVDKIGKLVVDMLYEEVLSYFGNLVVVKLNNKYGFVNIKIGKLVIELMYEMVGVFLEGLIVCRKY